MDLEVEAREQPHQHVNSLDDIQYVQKDSNPEMAGFIYAARLWLDYLEASRNDIKGFCAIQPIWRDAHD